MKPSKNFFNLIVEFEGLRLKAYKDSIGLFTIGAGTTIYPDGRKVRVGDVITEEQAYEYLEHDVRTRAEFLNRMISFPVTQNQYDAMMSLIYNIGIGAFANSSVWGKIKYCPIDPTIKDSWMRWNKARVNGQLKELLGLTRRRRKEVELYFKID